MKKSKIMTKGKGAAEIYPPLDPQSSCEIDIKRTPEEKKKIEETKKISIKEANAYSLMDGFGLRYITPYAIAAGANNAQIGLLSSLPSLLGNLSQLLTIKAMNKYSRKKIVFWGVFLQAVMWLVLLCAGSLYFVFKINGQLPANAIVIVYTLLILFGAFSGPAWSSWMKELITENRGDYFGKRARIAGAVALVGMLIAGFILDYFKGTQVFIGFIIIFTIAFVGRSISAFLMLKQYEPKFHCESGYYFTLLQFIKRMAYNNFGKFTIYYALICLAVNISGPFFAVYMLKNLGFSYVNYMSVVLSSSITSLLFIPAWGKFADRYGNLKVMRITGFFIPLIPFLWLFSAYLTNWTSHVFVYILIIEGFSGIVWAGFNLSAGNFIYDAVTKQRLAICVSYFSILAGIGVLIGATLGGIISSYNFTILGLSSLLFIFALSGVVRLAVYLIMDRKIMEVRHVEEFDMKDAKQKIKNLSLKRFSEYLDINILK